ncbi:TenA family transcriptional regulator [Frateuria defendens]|uniref:TenA family transcriptional regulator n=1 Tax=Frateuria defendens TaxID=2219559 RepID=UPI00066FC3B8|nr:iron-containing redox enzyme family protein [Frateuria defendens]
MNAGFELKGSLTDLLSYPQWAQDMVADAASVRQEVMDHELWTLMREVRLDRESTRNFMVGVWPVIERFPGYMANSLLKTRYGRSQGDDVARRWLVRNIRVEQNHAEYWLDWAEGAGVSREEVLNGTPPLGSHTLAQWCEDVSCKDSLAAGMIATNYAIEGVTGDWSQLVYDSAAYAESMPTGRRKASLRWLQLHAAYDDTHPWEALEIVCALVGSSPAADEVAHLTECVKRSYLGMRVLADRCLDNRYALRQTREEAA